MMAENSSKCRIAIIGAGVAGLTAGKTLLDSNFKDFQILEARSRFGGRMHTQNLNENSHIDLGAHWIHGQEGNQAYNFIKENQLPTIEDEDFYAGSVALTEGGYQHPIEPLIQCRFLVNQIEHDLNSKSLGHSVMNCYQKEQWKESFGIDWKVLDSVNNYICIVDASKDWFSTSVTAYEEYKECPGNQILALRDGYSDLLTKCVTSPELESRIRLNASVENIEWDQNDDGGITIKYGNGKILICDYVICTLPLGVLKENSSTLFTPGLPSTHLAAIAGLEFGCVEKIFLEFPHKWWQESQGVTFLYEEQHRRKAEELGKWEYGILGFYAVPSAPNVLCGWIKGNDAQRMAMSSDKEVQQRCMSLLKKFVGDLMEVPNSIKLIRSQWSVDPWSYGSYSSRSLQTEKTNVYAKDLAAPVFNNKGIVKLMFAGEATHSRFFSTVHGALESGEREATRVLKEIQISAQVNGSPVSHLYDVIIVGAGASGLAAARELKLQGNIRCCILEGSNYIGGRVKSVSNGQFGIVDAGAQWIHGEDNELYESIKNFNLIGDIDSLDGRGQYYTENGLIPEEISRKATKFIHEMQENAYTTSDVKGKVLEYYEAEYRNFLDQFEDGSPEKYLYLAFYHFCMRWEVIDNACSNLESLSHKCWQSFHYGEGRENMNPRNGYSSIIRSLTSSFNPEIHLNEEVSCIDYKTRGSVHTVVDRHYLQEAPVTIHCTSGRKFYASHIIVTCSLGKLKETHRNLFKPPLPESVAEVIENKIGYGTLNKIFLTFDEAWWGSNRDSIQFVHTNAYSSVSDWNSSDIFRTRNSSTMEESWMEGITGFDKIVNHDKTLCGWIGGKEAEFMETLSDKVIVKTCLELISKFTGKPVPQPVNHVITRWRQDPFARGSYSSRTHDLECIKKLQTPIFQTLNNEKIPVILFCGEALSLNHYSTVHGAMESGTEQARRLGNFIKERRKRNSGIPNLQSKL